MLLIALPAAHARAQADSEPAAPAIIGGTLIRLTTGDSGSPRQQVQTARIEQMHGDSMILHLVSAGPVHNGVVDNSVHIAFARRERSNTTAGLLVGIAGAALISLSSHRGSSDGGLDGTATAGFLLIPLGAIVGTAIKTVTWEPLPPSRYTVIVGAVGPGVGATIHLADHP